MSSTFLSSSRWWRRVFVGHLIFFVVSGGEVFRANISDMLDNILPDDNTFYFAIFLPIYALAMMIISRKYYRRIGIVNVYASKENKADSVFKVTVENCRKKDIMVQDVRLMFSEPYGVYSNHGVGLNMRIRSGKNAEFKFADVSGVLRRLYHPHEFVTVPHAQLRVKPRCILGTKESFVGKSIMIST